jgi:hypothetical protein
MSVGLLSPPPFFSGATRVAPASSFPSFSSFLVTFSRALAVPFGDRRQSVLYTETFCRDGMSEASVLISLVPVPQVTLKKHIANCSQGAALVAAILTGEADLLGSALCKWLHLLFPTATPLTAFGVSIKCEKEFQCC